MCKKLLCALLAVVLLLSGALPVRAEKEEEAEQVRQPDLRIGTVKEFLAFAEACRLDSYSMELYVVLEADLDLRGMMTDEALGMVDMFLDNALMGKLETVTIIHGKGTGALRKAVRAHLKQSRYVKEFRPGVYGEGEDGVTVVTLK